MSWTAAAAALLTIALWIPQRQVRTRPAAFPTPDLTSFVMLDNEPIGTGLVVRVKLPLSAFGDSPLVEAGDTREIEADVLLGEDGLAHGIRLVI